jgi:hypothetical protein
MLGQVLLFILLTPGVILTIPPGSKGIFFSGQTSIDAVVTAAVVFAALIYYKKQIPVFREILAAADSLI